MKAPRSWPNSSDSISSSGMAAQLTVTKGSAGALAAQVDGLGDQLLARAALARDQHPRIGGSHFFDQAEDLLDRRRRADHLVALQALLEERVAFPFQPRPLQGVLQRDQDALPLDRFLQEVEGADLDRLHGVGDGAVAGQHDDRQGGELVPDAF